MKQPPPGSIISRYSVLLSRLLSELIMCWQRPQPEKILVESAFLITQKHCNNLKQECWQHKFTCKQEEVYFFKAIHPQFAGRMMYYSILYESLLSCPDCPEAAKTFWAKELDRYDRFCNRYERVVEYLDENRTDEDERYFLMSGDRSTSVAEKTQFMCCSEQQSGVHQLRCALPRRVIVNLFCRKLLVLWKKRMRRKHRSRVIVIPGIAN